MAVGGQPPGLSRELLGGWHLVAPMQKLLGAIGWQLLGLDRLPLEAGRQVALLGRLVEASGVV